VATAVETRAETPTGRSIVLDVPGWPGNLAGQHVDVRLTAPDGYAAVRSYSLATAGAEERIQLAVDKLPDGEVSPYLVDDLLPGDQVEVHGPLGRWFVWRESQTEPVQLIAGGSGIVPLLAIARAHDQAASAAPLRLLVSARSRDDVFFADDLETLAGPNFEVTHVFTREAPAGWPTAPGRLTRDTLATATIAPTENPAVFVCGPTPFVEVVARWLVELGHDPSRIKTERFGGA
jgi:ferredoxin-NADP reductase